MLIAAAHYERGRAQRDAAAAVRLLIETDQLDSAAQTAKQTDNPDEADWLSTHADHQQEAGEVVYDSAERRYDAAASIEADSAIQDAWRVADTNQASPAGTTTNAGTGAKAHRGRAALRRRRARSGGVSR